MLFEIDAPDKPPGIVMQVIEPVHTIHERLRAPPASAFPRAAGTSARNALDKQV